MMDDLKQEPLEVATGSLKKKINTPKLFRFMSDLSNLFSRYYSKVHVLEVSHISDSNWYYYYYHY